jgi:hypothetical protein
MLVPPITFYAFLSKSLTSIPFLDDYHAVLGFLLLWKKESGIKHILEILTYQHTDYRLMFENAIFGAQYVILGHTNIKALSILGNLFVIPIFGMLYLIWRECGRPRDYTMLAFVPVSWILFQLQYASALNTAMASLQIIPVILFALLTCFLATKTSTASFLGTLLSLLFCIASSGNGLFMIPIVAVIYLQRRQFKRLAIWCCVSAIACLVYFHGYDYTVEAVHTQVNNNVLSVLEHFSLPYGAAFLGSVAAASNPLPAILFGIVLTIVFIFATRDRLFTQRPALYYSAMFFFVTGIAVSGLRSSLGLVTALGSRYRINSAVLLILLYLYLADKFYGVRIRPWILRLSACVFGVLLIGFNLASDRAGQKLLLTKRNKMEMALLRWERHEPLPPVSASATDDYTAENEKKGFYEPIEPTLSESIQEGIYKVPELPTEH